MDSAPEGTSTPPERLGRGWLLLTIVFGLYLLFRLGQGLLWLARHL